MKIISDHPFQKNQKLDQANRTKARDGTRASAQESFAETLQKAVQTAPESRPTVQADAVQVISLENRRAQSPPKDLSAAEELLQSVKTSLADMTRTDVGRIHRLEGLVHVFQV
jgi:hypothetical protein